MIYVNKRVKRAEKPTDAEKPKKKPGRKKVNNNDINDLPKDK